MASSISSTSLRMPSFTGSSEEAKLRVKRMRQELLELSSDGETKKLITLDRVDASGVKSSFKISSFSQPIERRIQTASYIKNIIEALYPDPTEEQRSIKTAFVSYLNGTLEPDRAQKNSGDITVEQLLEYFKNLHFAALDAEAVKMGAAAKTLPFANDKPEKIEGSLTDFLSHKGVTLYWSECIGEGAFGAVINADVGDVSGKYVYKVQNRALSKALTARESFFWREGDCAAARINDISHRTRPLFFIFRLVKEDAPEELHYVPANYVKSFGVRLPANTEVFLDALLMERAQGEELGNIISKNKTLVSINKGKHFSNIVRGIFHIIEEMQTHNFVHRDLKPENIFYNSQTGEVTLLDFGASVKLRKKEKSEDEGHLNSPTSVRIGGTPQYMSPRVLLGTPYSAEVDMFSFGMIILELIDSEEAECLARKRFPNDYQGGEGVGGTIPPAKYLSQFLKMIKTEGALEQAPSPAESQDSGGSFLEWGRSSLNALSAISENYFQGRGEAVAPKPSKIERFLDSNPVVREVIDLSFQASGGGEEGAAAYERLRNLPYFTAERPPELTMMRTQHSASKPYWARRVV